MQKFLNVIEKYLLLFPIVGIIFIFIVFLLPSSKAKKDPELPLKLVVKSDWKKGYKVTVDGIEYLMVTDGEAIRSLSKEI